MSARSDARRSDAVYSAGGEAPAVHSPLQIGDKVLAKGKAGVIEAIAWSMATETRLFTVAFDHRIRLTFRENEVTPL